MSLNFWGSVGALPGHKGMVPVSVPEKRFRQVPIPLPVPGKAAPTVPVFGFPISFLRS